MDPFTKPHLALGGSQRRQIFQIFIFSDLFVTKSTKSTNSDFFGMKLPKVNNKFHPAVIQYKDQPTFLLYAYVNDDNNFMIWKLTIIKYMQVFGCCVLVKPAWIQKNRFTKYLCTIVVRLTLAKLYPGTMNTINNYYIYSPGTMNTINSKPVPDIEVDDLDEKTDINSTLVIKWDSEIHLISS